MKNLAINKKTKKIYILTGILTMCSYIVLPFLAVYFTQKNLSVAQVGIILGISSFASSFCGIFSPYIENWLGIKRSMLVAIFIISVCYFLLSVINNYIFIILIIVLQGGGQGIINPLLKKTVALYNQGNENIAFRYRYIILCVAIIVGPMLGNVFNVFGVSSMLKITAVGCIISCLTLVGIDSKLVREKKSTAKQQKIEINFLIVFFIIWSILVFLIFSVFENVSPLAIQPYNSDAEKLFSIMIILNSVLAIVSQPVIIFLNEKLSLNYQILFGSLSFCGAYILFAYSEGDFLKLMLATIIFTIGEATLIPMLDVLISKISNEQQLTGIYAISEIKQLGFFIGPVLTTYFIQQYSVTIMYWAVALMCIFEIFLAFILLKKMK